MTEPNTEVPSAEDFQEDIGQVLADQWNNVRDPDGHLAAYDMQDQARAVYEEVVAPALGTLRWLHAEAVWHAKHHRAQAEQLGADKNIRQGALNGVLGRPGAADYYEAIEAVADLANERRRLTARMEAEGLPLALLRKGVPDLLKQIDAQAQLIDKLDAELARTAEEDGWLSEACRLTVREAATVRAERDRLLNDAAGARETLMALVGGDWTVKPSLSELAHFVARFWGEDRRKLEANRG